MMNFQLNFQLKFQLKLPERQVKVKKKKKNFILKSLKHKTKKSAVLVQCG